MMPEGPTPPIGVAGLPAVIHATPGLPALVSESWKHGQPKQPAEERARRRVSAEPVSCNLRDKPTAEFARSETVGREIRQDLVTALRLDQPTIFEKMNSDWAQALALAYVVYLHLLAGGKAAMKVLLETAPFLGRDRQVSISKLEYAALYSVTRPGHSRARRTSVSHYRLILKLAAAQQVGLTKFPGWLGDSLDKRVGEAQELFGKRREPNSDGTNGKQSKLVENNAPALDQHECIPKPLHTDPTTVPVQEPVPGFPKNQAANPNAEGPENLPKAALPAVELPATPARVTMSIEVAGKVTSIEIRTTAGQRGILSKLFPAGASIELMDFLSRLSRASPQLRSDPRSLGTRPVKSMKAGRASTLECPIRRPT